MRVFFSTISRPISSAGIAADPSLTGKHLSTDYQLLAPNDFKGQRKSVDKGQSIDDGSPSALLVWKAVSASLPSTTSHMSLTRWTHLRAKKGRSRQWRDQVLLIFLFVSGREKKPRKESHLSKHTSGIVLLCKNFNQIDRAAWRYTEKPPCWARAVVAGYEPIRQVRNGWQVNPTRGGSLTQKEREREKK